MHKSKTQHKNEYHTFTNNDEDKHYLKTKIRFKFYLRIWIILILKMFAIDPVNILTFIPVAKKSTKFAKMFCKKKVNMKIDIK